MSSEFQHTLGGRKMDDTYAGEDRIQFVALVLILIFFYRRGCGLFRHGSTLEHARRLFTLTSTPLPWRKQTSVPPRQPLSQPSILK